MKTFKPFLYILAATLTTVVFSSSAIASIYTEAGIHRDDERFVGWAHAVVDYYQSAAVSTAYSNPEAALGKANGSLFVLGDLTQDQIKAGATPGYITLSFVNAICNGDGADFAVFENGFMSGGKLFAELAYVAVSTDGINFATFPSISETEAAVGGYGTIDPTDVYNLAGKHVSGYGTGFDLDDLLGHEFVLSGLIDLMNINYVMIIDIPGSGDYLDSLGNPIYDAWHTFGTGGFDLDAVGVINEATPTTTPEPATMAIFGLGIFGMTVFHRRAWKNS